MPYGSIRSKTGLCRIQIAHGVFIPPVLLVRCAFGAVKHSKAVRDTEVTVERYIYIKNVTILTLDHGKKERGKESHYLYLFIAQHLNKNMHRNVT